MLQCVTDTWGLFKCSFWIFISVYRPHKFFCSKKSADTTAQDERFHLPASSLSQFTGGHQGWIPFQHCLFIPQPSLKADGTGWTHSPRKQGTTSIPDKAFMKFRTCGMSLLWKWKTRLNYIYELLGGLLYSYVTSPTPSLWTRKTRA